MRITYLFSQTLKNQKLVWPIVLAVALGLLMNTTITTAKFVAPATIAASSTEAMGDPSRDKITAAELLSCPADTIAYWELNETGGPPYVDSVDGHDGVCAGTCPSSTSGQVGDAQQFSRSAQTGISVTTHTDFDWGQNSSFSIEFWMKGLSGQTCDGHSEVAIGRSESPGPHWWLGCAPGGVARFQLEDNFGFGTALEGPVVNDGDWHHIVGVRDGTGNVNRLYVDGIEVASETIAYTSDFSATSAGINLGWFNHRTHGPGFRLDGTLDEVAVYSRTLSTIEVQQHYSNGYVDVGYCPSGDFGPTIVSDPVTEVLTGQTYSYDVNASGNPPPTYTLNVSPSGMSINDTTGVISWAPSTGQAGQHAVEVEANNVAGSDLQAFTITVTVPTAPEIISTPVTETLVNELYTYDVEATGDPPPTYTLTTSPSGMTINETTGLIQWTPTVTGSFSTTVAASNPADVVTQTFTINVVDPGIAITKSPATQSVVEGGTVSFTIAITNTGNTSLDNIQVSDPLSPDCDNSIGTLTASDSTSYTCSEANVTADFTNAIAVTGTYTPPSGSPVNVTDTASALVDALAPAITITKSPVTQTVVNGGTAAFTITISNTGDTNLNSIQVDDPLSPGCNNTISFLNSGASTSYTCSEANVTADFTNVATVTAQDPLDNELEDSDTATVDVIDSGITIAKTPDSQQVTSGDSAIFTITVTNTGTVTLESVQVSDPLSPDCDNAIGTLTAGSSTSYTCSRTNVTTGFTNVATVTARDPLDNELEDSDTATVTVIGPSITIAKTPDSQQVTSGDSAIFTIAVTNTGTVTLESIQVSDPLSPDCDNAIGTLTAGSNTSYTCSRTNVTAGFTNVATVTAQDPLDNELEDSDTATVTVSESDTFIYLPIILRQ